MPCTGTSGGAADACRQRVRRPLAGGYEDGPGRPHRLDDTELGSAIRPVAYEYRGLVLTREAFGRRIALEAGSLRGTIGGATVGVRFSPGMSVGVIPVAAQATRARNGERPIVAATTDGCGFRSPASAARCLRRSVPESLPCLGEIASRISRHVVRDGSARAWASQRRGRHVLTAPGCDRQGVIGNSDEEVRVSLAGRMVP